MFQKTINEGMFMSKFKNVEDKRNYIESTEVQKEISQLLNNSDYSKQPDEDQLNPWKDHRQSLKGEISKLDAMGLQISSLMYEGAFSKDNPPSKETKELMQKFFENAVGNTNLNSFLNQDGVKADISYAGYLTKSTAINQIAYFSFKTRNLDKMEHVLEKLDKVHQAAISGKPLDVKDKITLKEFAVASDLAKTLPLLEEMNKSGFIEGNEKLEKMYKNASKAKEIISHLEKENTKELQNVGPGVIVLDNTFKKSNILNKVMSFVDKVITLFSSHGHASMLHFNQADKAQRSHINPNLQHDDFDINKQLYSNMYKVDPVALIPKENHILLKQVYGENWKQEVANKFKMIENEIHTKAHDKFGNLSASSEKEQHLAGLANVIPFGHKQLKSNDFKELHNKVMSGGYAKEKDSNMLCSEFCATTIVASIVELDKQIKEDLGKSKLGKQIGVDLTKDIVQVPFGKHENLHKMHPDRLLKVLKDHNCVEPVITKASSQYIKEEALKIGKVIKQKIVKNTSTVMPLIKNQSQTKHGNSI